MQLVAAARACLGAPFVPQGRSRSAGLDCAGLIIVAAGACGVQLFDDATYTIPPQPQQLLGGIAQNGLLPAALIVPGALLLFRLGGQAQHMALATGDDTMIHAYAPAGRVVETTIGHAWHSRLIGIYSFNKEI